MRHSRICAWVLIATLSGLLTVSGAPAQTALASVAGRVTDSQRAPVPNVSVTLENDAQGYKRTTESGAQGDYRFTLVPPGRYTLKAAGSGFAPAQVRLEVVVATPVRADISLTVKPVHVEVQVLAAGGVRVQTENAELGMTVNPTEMAELPSVNRSPYDFIVLMAGAAYSNDQLGVGFAVNGGRTQSANYLLDGGENNDTFMSAPGIDIPMDSIQEFTVQTSHYSAEYGRNSAFIANVATKSGTNSYHGSLYEYNRNSLFAANSYDNNAHSLPRPEFNRNQFGGTLGGPIRHSKLFFFAAVEPILVRSSGPSGFFVPSPQLLAVSSPATQEIFNRFPLPLNLSDTDVYHREVCPYGANCDASTGQGLMDIAAFAFATRIGPINAGAGMPQNTLMAMGRLDWTVDPNTLLTVRYAYEYKHELATVNQPYSSTLDLPTTGGGQNAAIDVSRSWSPRTVTETRFSYSRTYGDQDRWGGTNPTVPQPIFPSFYIQNEPDAVLPSGTGFSGGPENLYQFIQTYTRMLDRHALKVGGLYDYRRENIGLGYFTGEIAEADFLDTQGFVDGAMRSYTIAVNPKGQYPGMYVSPPFGPPSFVRHFHYNEPALFVTDTWKMTRQLTLTAGLRWEYFGELHSPGAEHTLDSNFYPGPGQNYLEQIASGEVLRTVDAAGDLRGRFYLPEYNNFAPRVGVAYDVFGDGKTVLRSGAGIFYDRRVGWENFRLFLNPPNFSFTTLQNIPLTMAMLSDQFAAFPNEPVQLNQSDGKGVDSHLRTAYTSAWNITLEHEFAGNFVLAASYLGSSGTHLYSVNTVSRSGSGGLLDPSCISRRYASDGVTRLGPDYSGCSALNPNLTKVVMRGNDGHSSFEALEVGLESRQLSRTGLEFGVNYTLSHSIDNQSFSGASGGIGGGGGGSLDAFNPSLDRGSSDFDQRHRIGLHFVWQIPSGRDSQAWTRRYVLSGWEVSGLGSYQSGQPFTIYDSGVPDSLGEQTRPRLTGPAPRRGGLTPDASSPNNFLYLPINQVYDNDGCMANTAPFACEISVNGPFSGTLPRNSFRQPGSFYLETAVLKNIPLPHEGLQLQLRGEFYNLLNHPNLYVNVGSNDVAVQSFAPVVGQSLPGVTASYRDSRQVVIAVKLLF